MNLARLLHEKNIPYVAYDPLAMSEAETALPSAARFAESAAAVCVQADLTIIMTDDAEFKNLDSADFGTPDKGQRPRVLLDCWNLYKPNHFTSDIEYVRVGQGMTKVSRGKA